MMLCSKFDYCHRRYHPCLSLSLTLALSSSCNHRHRHIHSGSVKLRFPNYQKSQSISLYSNKYHKATSSSHLKYPFNPSPPPSSSTNQTHGRVVGDKEEEEDIVISNNNNVFDKLGKSIRGVIKLVTSSSSSSIIWAGGGNRWWWWWWWNLPTVDCGTSSSPKRVTVGGALTRMWQLMEQDRWIIFAAFFFLVLAAISEIAVPHCLTASIFSMKAAEITRCHRNTRLLVLLCITSGICSGLRGCCFGIVNMILVRRMREALYSALLFQDVSFFDSETVGNLTSRLGSDCQQVSRVIGDDLNMILRNCIQGIGALAYLLMLSWPLGLCSLIICSTLAAVLPIYGKYQKKAAKLVQEFVASANQVAQETFSLMRIVRIHGTETLELARCKLWLKKLANINVQQSAAYGFWSFSFSTLKSSTKVIAGLIGGLSILDGHFTSEQLTKFMLYSDLLISSTWFIGNNFSSLMRSIGASEKVFQMIDLVPGSQFTSQGLKLQRLTGHIELVDVTFYYPSRALVPVLQHVNLSINPGEVLAIVGLSGSGKSTLVNLLLRLYDPKDGQILIDGIPLGDLDIRKLRESIGFVGQEPKLFRMDVASNIKYGCAREVNQEDVELAAKQACAHDFIMSLPNGYGTFVDDDLLSGGQKQRIAIARAILRDPAIMILDEATSALDAETEHYVKGIIHASRIDSMSKRTVIVIAHRLSTIQAADRIVAMDGGRIVEIGNHKELADHDGLYAQLTRRQAEAIAVAVRENSI